MSPQKFILSFSHKILDICVVDTETGVNYLVHDTGITPLLDKNGTVVITEINK